MDDANEAEPFITVTGNTTTVLHSNYDNLVVTEVNLLPSCKATTEMCDGSNVGHLRSHEFRQNFHFLGHYRPQLRKGYAFTGVCHSVHGGGCISACTGQTYPSMHWGRHPSSDGYCSGPYASYWNAFLLKYFIN